MPKKVDTFRGLKVGQKFRVVSNSNMHNYPLNVDLTLARTSTQNRMERAAIRPEGSSYNELRVCDIEIYCDDITTLEADLKEKQERFILEEQELKDKIAFCKTYELEEFDDNIFKILTTLENLKEDPSDIKKAQLIAKLINK